MRSSIYTYIYIWGGAKASLNTYLLRLMGGGGRCVSRNLDGPAIRNANRGDLPESICKSRFAAKPIFITFEQFARIASNLRFAIFKAPKRDSQKGGSDREP